MPVTSLRVATVPLVVLMILAPVSARAHGLYHEGELHPAGVLSVLVLAFFWLSWLLGAMRESPQRRDSWLFHCATLLCAIALFGPLDAWAKVSTAAHMTQHMLLMVLIAPMWVLSRPLPQWYAALGRPVLWISRPLLRLARYPVLAAGLHGLAIWFWHTPLFYMLAVDSYYWHVIEHLFFLLTAGVFWWAVLYASAARLGQALLALLLTLMHTGFLGALLTFSTNTLYGESRHLQDQQLAGLIMWVPSAIPYLAASGLIAWRWYQQLRRY